MVLATAEIIEKTVTIHYIIEYDYENVNKVMRIIKENNIQIVSQNRAEICEIEITVRKKNAEKIVGIFNNMFKVKIKIKE